MKRNKLFYVLSLAMVLVGAASFNLSLAHNEGGSEDNKGKGVMVGLLRGMDAHTDDSKTEAKLAGTGVKVGIEENGQTLVRGAKVTAVSGNMISATTAWGAMNLNWNINVVSNTSFVRKSGSAGTAADVKTGDIVSFSGTVTGGVSNGINVDAKTIKDWSMVKQNIRSKIEGTIKSVSGTTVPTNIVVTSEGKDYSTYVGATTSLVNDSWAPVTLSTFVVGNKVTAYGIVDVASATVTATVLKNESI